MALITIKTAESHSAFHSMCEGMWEVARDDNVSPDGDAGPYAASFERLITATGYVEGMSYPVSFPLTADDSYTAQNVLDNMDDNETLDLDEPETYLAGRHNITLQRAAPEMGAQEALEEALVILTGYAIDHDTASPEGWRARCAIDTLTAILQQRGCEYLGDVTGGRVKQSGKLVELIDVIVFG
jgi:hypothetical protein